MKLKDLLLIAGAASLTVLTGEVVWSWWDEEEARKLRREKSISNFEAILSGDMDKYQWPTEEEEESAWYN